MEDMFHVTHDERELIIECIEREIKATESRPGNEFDDQMYVAHAECKIDHLKQIIIRMREHL